MGTELFPETVENFHPPTRLSDLEDFVEFCHHESFKTYHSGIYTAKPQNCALTFSGTLSLLKCIQQVCSCYTLTVRFK